MMDPAYSYSLARLTVIALMPCQHLPHVSPCLTMLPFTRDSPQLHCATHEHVPTDRLGSFELAFLPCGSPRMPFGAMRRGRAPLQGGATRRARTRRAWHGQGMEWVGKRMH